MTDKQTDRQTDGQTTVINALCPHQTGARHNIIQAVRWYALKYTKLACLPPPPSPRSTYTAGSAVALVTLVSYSHSE